MYYTEEDFKKNIITKKRNDILLTFEAEFDEFLPLGEDEWTKWDKNSFLIVHKNFVFYSKNRVNELYEEEKKEYEESMNEENYQEFSKKMEKRYDIFNISDHRVESYFEKYDPSILKIEELFDPDVHSFPNLIVETPHFYQCGDNIKRKIKIDDIDKELLEKIKKSFIYDINPLLNDLEDYIFEGNDDKIYCLSPFLYSKNLYFKYGIFFNAKNSQKYPNDVTVFFSFNKLSIQERNLVMCYYDMASFYDEKKNLIFVEYE